eukprot:717512-Prymnesium_polylepis.1
MLAQRQPKVLQQRAVGCKVETPTRRKVRRAAAAATAAAAAADAPCDRGDGGEEQRELLPQPLRVDLRLAARIHILTTTAAVVAVVAVAIFAGGARGRRLQRAADGEGGAQLDVERPQQAERRQQRRRIVRLVLFQIESAHDAPCHLQLGAAQAGGYARAEGTQRQPDVLAVHAQPRDAALALDASGADGAHDVGEADKVEEAGAVCVEAGMQLLELVRLQVLAQQLAQRHEEALELDHAAALLVPDVERELHLTLGLAWVDEVRAEERADHHLDLLLVEAGAAHPLGHHAGTRQVARPQLRQDRHAEHGEARKAVSDGFRVEDAREIHCKRSSSFTARQADR